MNNISDILKKCNVVSKLNQSESLKKTELKF